MNRLVLIIKWFLMLGLFFLILSFVENASFNQFATISEINIEKTENQFITEEMVGKFIEESQMFNDSSRVYDFDLHTLEQLLSYHPSIDNVEAFVSHKGHVSINVLQRDPIVRIISKEESYYLDANGHVMPLSDNYTARLVVVTGEVDTTHHSDILSLVNILNESPFWTSQITQIHFINQELILVPRVGEHKIHFGQLDKIKEKLDNLYHFYKEAMPIKGWQTYSDISLKYNNQIVCTKK